MKQLLLSLFILTIGFWVQAEPSGTAYVYTETASLWQEPGYSWKVCDQLNKKDTFNDFNTLVHTATQCGDTERKFLLGGENVEVLMKDKKFEAVEKTLTVDGQSQTMKFYHVEVTLKDDNGKPYRKQGWMSADQITRPELPEEPSEEEIEAPAKSAKAHCPPGPRKEALHEVQKNAADIKHRLQEQNDSLSLGPEKSDKEIDHFVCLYRKQQINDTQFDKMLLQFHKAAKKAESTIKIPYGLTMCFMLIESGLYFDPKEDDEYRGIGQFGSPTVEDLGKLSKNEKLPFSQMWNDYTQFPLTDRAVRRSYNPEVTTGAVALMLRWIYDNRLTASGCRGCSQDDSFKSLNRRDVYLMLIGYDSGPYGLSKIANAPLSEMRKSQKLPQETKNYMTQMDRCLAKGQEEKFRVGKHDKKELVSQEYKDRKNSCDKSHPAS